MVTYKHKQLIDRLKEIEKTPNDPASFREWIRGREHLKLLQQNAREDEIIVAALSPEQTCINSFVARADHPDLQGEIRALKQWSPHPLHYDAKSYEWYGDVHAMQRDGSGLHDLPLDVYPLVFGRSINEVPDRDGTYYEIAQ